LRHFRQGGYYQSKLSNMGEALVPFVVAAGVAYKTEKPDLARAAKAGMVGASVGSDIGRRVGWLAITIC